MRVWMRQNRFENMYGFLCLNYWLKAISMQLGFLTMELWVHVEEEDY